MTLSGVGLPAAEHGHHGQLLAGLAAAPHHDGPQPGGVRQPGLGQLPHPPGHDGDVHHLPVCLPATHTRLQHRWEARAGSVVYMYFHRFSFYFRAQSRNAGNSY